MSTATLTTSRDPKGQKFIATVAAAYDKAGLDDERAQWLNESSEFVPGLRQLIEQCSAMNEFADEEVPSTYGYLSGYRGNRDQPIDIIVADFEQRTAVLDGLLNCGMKFDKDWLVAAHTTCPGWVEKFFPMFDWRAITQTYGEAVQKVLDAIEQTRGGRLHNYREGQLGSQYLRQHTHAVERLQRLAEQQKRHDILVVPAQFGIRHRGRSVRRAREVMIGSEFGSGAFNTGIMLLTHPERLQHYDDLWPDCPSDEFSPGGGGVFGSAPCFYFYDGRVGFGTDFVAVAHGHYGSVSLFLPQN